MSWFDDNGIGTQQGDLPRYLGGIPTLDATTNQGFDESAAGKGSEVLINGGLPLPPGATRDPITGAVVYAPGTTMANGDPGYNPTGGSNAGLPGPNGPIPGGASGAPTLNRQDPASVAAYVQYYASQPGANPSLARDPQYWIGKISSGELGDDPNYIISKFMQPEGAPAGQAGSLGSLTGQPGGFGGMLQPYSTDPAALTANPSYQFARDQGINAVDRSAAAKGTLLTGGNEKDLATFGSGLASQYDQQFYNRYTNDQDRSFNKLYNLSALGKPTTP